jgi:hypothetical protein
VVVFRSFLFRKQYLNGAVLGEFNCVGKEVQQDLPQAAGIAHEKRGETPIELKLQV